MLLLLLTPITISRDLLLHLPQRIQLIRVRHVVVLDAFDGVIHVVVIAPYLYYGTIRAQACAFFVSGEERGKRGIRSRTQNTTSYNEGGSSTKTKTAAWHFRRLSYLLLKHVRHHHINLLQ